MIALRCGTTTAYAPCALQAMRTRERRAALHLITIYAPVLMAGVDQHVLEIRKIVRPELEVPSVTSAVSHALLRPSVCVPDGGIVLSVVNKHHARLRPVQFHFIRHRPCFMRRVVSVCFSNMTDSFGKCITSTFTVPPSDFRRSNYANLIWAKWRIIIDALACPAAKMALWLDADVLILRNPWSALGLLGPQATDGPNFDIRFQSEGPPTAEQADPCTPPLPIGSLESRLNGGQLLVTSAMLASHIYGARPRNLSNTDRLDQDWADALLYNVSRFSYLLENASYAHEPRRRYSSCILPSTFVAECWNNPKFVHGKLGRSKGIKLLHGSLGCQAASHHFNCVPTRRLKGSMMKDLVTSWSTKCGNKTAYE